MAEGAASGPCRDAGASANNDEMIKFVWLLLRALHCLVFFANVYHVLLCFSLHAAGLHMALTQVFFGALVLGAAALALVTGKSRVYELQATTVIVTVAQCALALCMLLDNAEWTVYDISFMFISRAFHAAFIYGRVVLGFLDKKEPRPMLVACRGTAVVVMACMRRKLVAANPAFFIVYICGLITHTLIGLLITKTGHVLREERDLLKQVRDRLQQHVDCQDSMWRSVFDATLLCDSTGCAVSASAQAVDFLKYEAADAVVGQAVSSLAAPEEQSRISRFLKDVVSSPSSQAMTIQATFLKKDQTPVELQINAVRVLQDICGSSSEGAFGILIGTRLVEAPREEHPAMPPDHRPPQTGAAEVSSYPDSEDMWIAFDAGTEHFGIIDCSPELCFEGQHLGLQSLFPPTASKSLETSMVDEVAACGELGGTASSIIERFHLRLPAAPARSIVAEQAWLEVLPTEVDQDGDLSLPAVLWLRGVACRRWSRSRDGKKPAKSARLVKQQLTSILENGDGDAPRKLVEQQSVADSDEITPSDSVSVQGLKFLVRRRDEGVAEDEPGALAEQQTVAVGEQLTPLDSALDGISAPSGVHLRRRL